MKLFLLSACVFLAGVHVTQALRCMQGVENDSASETNKEKVPQFVECGIVSAAASAAVLAGLKPNTITFPSTDYKCYHMRLEHLDSKKGSVMKGCIYKDQNVCDGKFKLDTVQEVFCSQCEYDECNSAFRFASNWKILSLTLVTIVCFFMK